LRGAGERGFCAGGDIRALYEDAKAGRLEGPAAFFRDEYRLNAKIARFKKPIVVFMDGIVMGGGIGLSAHASHRVVTPRATLAMPEVGIGFVPDVGGTFLLARAENQFGTHAALTAARLGAADALLCGLADVCVATDRLPQLAAALEACGDAQAVGAALQAHAEPPPPGVLEKAQGWISLAYAADTVEGILQALQARPEPEARAAASEMLGKSPTSLKITLRLLQRARVLGQLEPCLQQEYDAALGCMKSHDFVEGVRAAVVDKDRNPKWSPATLDKVSADVIDTFFVTSPETALFE
jgi:enoyl-CoA hydratase